MSKLPDAIKRLVGELDITPDGAISVAGKRYFAPAPGASEAQISNNLATCIYHLAYLQSTAPGSAPAAGHSDINLSGIIRQANAGKTAMASDWILVELLPDNAVLASRHGKTRRFQAGQFLAIDGEFPLTPGTGLLVRHINGSDKLQHGFHYCFGDGHQDPNDKSPMVRLYWNVRVAQVAVFTSLLTTALNRYKIPFNFKITNHVADFDRADNAVLYVSERWFRIVTLALEPVLPQLLRTLDQYVPLFTKRLAHGIGFAEDPGSGDSFGHSRSKLVAAAIIAAHAGRQDRKIALDEVEARFGALVAAAGLHPDALYLNPGSTDHYTLVQAKAIS